MKIQGPNHSNFNPYQKQIQRQEDIKKAGSKEDQLQISKEAIKMQETNKLDPARQKRVEDLKQKVQSGEYNIDPQTTAKKMLEFWNKRS